MYPLKYLISHLIFESSTFIRKLLIPSRILLKDAIKNIYNPFWKNPDI